MRAASRREKFRALMREEMRHLTTIQACDRVWEMPLAAAFSSGLPLLIGAYYHRLDYGLLASLGGLVFLYLPSTPLSHRMVSVMACASGMVACYTLGVMSQILPALLTPMVVFASILVTMVCRFYAVGPPGSLFFIMAASIGAYTPGGLATLPQKVGFFSLGTLWACLVGFLYSLHVLRRQAPRPAPLLQLDFDFVVTESVIIGMFVGLSLALAQALQVERAYWVPVSCLAVIQGTSLRAVWSRQLHRILGTGVGLLLSWGLLLLPLNVWSLAVIMMTLTFVIESIVTRHYALAVVFITPLALLLAEASSLHELTPALLVQARFFDTILGCFVGLLGGMCLHHSHFRAVASHQIRRLIPERFR